MDAQANGTYSIVTYGENDTQIFVTEANVTENGTYEVTIETDAFQKVLLISLILTITLCISTVSFGIVSWTLIPKWRQFRNYVFINVCFTGGLFTTVSMLTFIPSAIFLEFTTMLGVSSFVCWLLISSIIFYVDVVKIFSYSYDHMYLKSSIFAWGLPALSLIIDNFVYIDLTDWMMICVSATSVLLYCRVLYTLMQRAKVRGSSNMPIGKKIRIATFIFLISGCAMMLPVHLASQMEIEGLTLKIIVFLFLLQIMLINVLFLMLKSHRSLWRQYLQRRLVRNGTVNTSTTG